MIKIIFKSPCAGGQKYLTYNGDINANDLWEFLETHKFLWLDEHTFIATDNIAYIVKVG